MHAAEGVLYREAMLAAARKLGWTAHAVDSAGLTDIHQELTAIGRAAGRPRAPNREGRRRCSPSPVVAP
jgi:hypothetical protein